MTKELNKSDIITFLDNETGSKKKPTITHNNAAHTVVHGSNSQIINNKVIDYKIDNTAIENGRASIGLRKRGDRVDPIHMSPKEFRNFLYFTYKIPGKNGWNGIEKSDFAQNWEADETQVITTKEAALKYLKIYNSLSKNKIENREKEDRRKKRKLYYAKNKRTKIRRIADKKDAISYFICYGISFYGLLFWAFLVVYFNYIKG